MRSGLAMLALPLALGSLGLGPPASHAQEVQEAQPALSPAQPTAADAKAGQPRSPRKRGVRRTPEQWWQHAREMLLEGLTLSDEQSQRVDEIIGTQVAARRRARDLQDELRLAQRQKDVQRGATLRAQLRANHENLKDPYLRIEQVRSVLTEEQRPTFDRNRARLVAESQQARDARPRRKPKKAGQAAAPLVESEPGDETE